NLLERVILAEIYFKHAAGRDALDFCGFSIELNFAFSVETKAAIVPRPVCGPMFVAIVRLHVHVVEFCAGAANTDIATRDSWHRGNSWHCWNSRNRRYSGHSRDRRNCRHTGALEHG